MGGLAAGGREQDEIRRHHRERQEVELPEELRGGGTAKTITAKNITAKDNNGENGTKVPREGARYQETRSQEEDGRRDDERDDDKDAINDTRGIPCSVTCSRRPLPGPLPTAHCNKKEAKEDKEAYEEATSSLRGLLNKYEEGKNRYLNLHRMMNLRTYPISRSRVDEEV